MTDREKHYYNLGYERGISIADFVSYAGRDADGETLYYADGPPVDYETIVAQCYESESNDRQFSPFEFIAHEINSYPDADDLWQAFDDGISEGILSTLESIEKD